MRKRTWLGFMVVLAASLVWGKSSYLGVTGAVNLKGTPVVLEGAENGIQLMDVTFYLPKKIGPRRHKLSTTYEALVRVKNTGQQDRKVGIALALFDEEGNLVAAGSGGSKLGHISPGETEEFHVVFHYVFTVADTATRFHLGMEVR